jgi:hypothetical protein
MQAIMNIVMHTATTVRIITTMHHFIIIDTTIIITIDTLNEARLPLA